MLTYNSPYPKQIKFIISIQNLIKNNPKIKTNKQNPINKIKIKVYCKITTQSSLPYLIFDY